MNIRIHHMPPNRWLAAADIEFNRGDSLAGQAHLQKLLAEHSESPQASLATMPNQNTLSPYNAMALYAAAESLVFTENKPDSALVIYKYIANKFPDLAAKADYTAAWILDQVIGVEDSSAYFAYADIVKKYPQTEFSQAASERISPTIKPSTRKPTPSENQSDDGEQVGDSQINPDSAAELAGGLPLAPNVKTPGVFIYPEALLSRELRGKVIFKIRLDLSGRVEQHEIIGPSGEYAIDHRLPRRCWQPSSMFPKWISRNSIHIFNTALNLSALISIFSMTLTANGRTKGRDK